MNMKKHLISVVVILMNAVTLTAGSDKDEKVRFAYDLDFEMNFDNREFYRSQFTESMTIFGARLTPSVGIDIPQMSHSMNHRLMVGIDIMKNFGASPVQHEIAGAPEEELDQTQNNLKLFREMTIYYKLDKKFNRTGLELYAGIFPRKATSGSYSEAFFSDSLKFYDNNLEGLLIKINRPKARYEIGCDWMGQKGYVRKEKFMIFSAGEGSVTPFMKLGYAGYMLHFAGSHKAGGVVDNILLNPYVKFDIGYKINFQEFSFRLGYLQAMQNDREFRGHYDFPRGGEFDLIMKKWNIGVHNMFFYGTDMMPYYNNTDAGGDKYGSRLYLGSPFYRVHDHRYNQPPYDPMTNYAAMYDRLDVFYEPHIGKFLKIRVLARFHFNDMKYSGCQQMVGVLFNLHGVKRNR